MEDNKIEIIVKDNSIEIKDNQSHAWTSNNSYYSRIFHNNQWIKLDVKNETNNNKNVDESKTRLDANKCLENGTYRSCDWVNTPERNATVDVLSYNDDCVKQIQTGNGMLYSRLRLKGVWTGWVNETLEKLKQENEKLQNKLNKCERVYESSFNVIRQRENKIKEYKNEIQQLQNRVTELESYIANKENHKTSEPQDNDEYEDVSDFNFVEGIVKLIKKMIDEDKKESSKTIIVGSLDDLISINGEMFSKDNKTPVFGYELTAQTSDEGLKTISDMIAKASERFREELYDKMKKSGVNY